MLRIAHQIVCVNMGIAFRAIPASSNKFSANSVASFLRHRQAYSSGTTDLQASLDKVS